MKHSALMLAALASLAPLGLAQTETTVPEGMATTYTGNTTLLWRSTLFHYQCVYDTRHFFNQNINHPIEITRLRFRALNGTVDAGGQTYPQVTVKLSTGQFDSANMSATFAANEGLDVTTVYSGPVTLLPSNGTTPNNHHIDLVLTTPFLYNPENGPLLVDVDAPQAPSGTIPNQAASNNHLTQFARRCSTATANATTGALSGFAAAMTLDYNIPAGTAFGFQYGLGCYNKYVSFYEQFPAGTVDLGSGSPGVTVGQTMIPNGVGGYIVVNGVSGFHTPTSPDLLLADDAISTPQPLGFTFPYPGGSTTDVTVESNGQVWLQTPTHTSFIVSTGGVPLTTRGAVIAAFNDDFDPTPATGGGSIHFDSDPANGVAYITWLNVPIWNAAPSTPRQTNTIQVALFSNGTYEVRYQQLGTNDSWTLTTVGFSPGANNKVPPPSDISAAGFVTETDLDGLILSTDQRPVLGRTINLTTTAIPASSPFTFMFLSFIKNTSGSSLAGLGMPGCNLYAGDLLNLPIMSRVSFGNPSVTTPVVIPNNPAFVGVSMAAQSASYVPGVNALGFLSSNGMDLSLGNL